MNLNQIQNISMIYAYAFKEVPKLVVRDKNNILFSANFINYHNNIFWTDYIDGDGDTQSINIELTENKNLIHELKNAFGKKYRLPSVNRWPNWTDNQKLENIIDLVTTYQNELPAFNVQPSEVKLIEINQPLKVLLVKSDDEFTIVGMQ